MDAATRGQTPTSPRPRSRGFSFRSDKSGGSKPKEAPADSPQAKERRDSIFKGSKANPNAALVESQPAAANLLEESTIQPLRAVQHKDKQGNIITDPDLSNPTRPRLERPLDTIRSFEKAIDNGYKRRTSYARSESFDQSTSQGGHSRRGSYYGGYDNGTGAGYSRYSPNNGGGYYGAQRPDSYMHPGPHVSSRARHTPRQQSDSMLYAQRPYGQHSHQQSQDTMNTGMTNGSDSTGPWAIGTDPSSENSSIDKNVAAGNKSNGIEHYGPNGYPSNGGVQGSIPEEGGAYPVPRGAPPVQFSNGQSRPIPLGNSMDASVSPPTTKLPSTARPEPEKKKGWLKRRFSKKG